MKLPTHSHPRRMIVAFVLATASTITIANLVACADSGTPAAEPDGGGPPPVPSGADGSDADVALPDAGDAAVRTCSDQGFCHVALPPNETLRGVWGSGAVVWAVSEQGDVLRWDGQKWNVHAQKLGALHAIWGSGPTDIWIGGESGLFHGTGASPQALVFEPVDAPGDPAIPILSIWGSGPSDVVAVGGFVDTVDFGPRGRVVRLRASGDGGASWELDPISSNPLVFKHVWGSATVGTWVAGDDDSGNSQTSGVFARAPGADDLEPITIDAFALDEGPEQGIPGTISGAGMTADGRVLVIGTTKSATPSLWYGALAAGSAPVWSYRARELNDPVLRAVWSGGGNETWLAGDYGRLRSSTGEKWMQAALMIADFPVIEPLYGIWGTAPDDFWVVGRNIAIHRMPRKDP